MNTVLCAYYAFVKSTGQSNTRYDEVCSTGDYAPFEALRNAAGQLFIYYRDLPINYSAAARKRALKCLTAKGKNISSIYVLDEHDLCGVGDIRDTNDAFLILFDEAETRIEVFIAKGTRNHRNSLYNAFTEKHFEKNIHMLRLKAMKNGQGRAGT